MALAKTVTKVFPNGGKVGIHLELKDDGVVVIDRDFVDGFVKGETLPNSVRDAIGQAAQAAIDEYVENKAMYDAAAYDTVVSQIDNNLNISE